MSPAALCQTFFPPAVDTLVGGGATGNDQLEATSGR
jgi:hypothetical protein